MSENIRKLCVTAMGVALFVVLSMCLQVPVFDNYYLCLGYVVMTVYCYSFGAGMGTMTGVLSVILYCILINGLRGMPGWAAGNAVIGAVLGTLFVRYRAKPMRAADRLLVAAAVVLSTAAGILGVKSLVECVLYGQPFMLRAGKNMSGFLADAFVILASLPLCPILYPAAKKAAGQ
ncbi:MAG: ECF transporter S component [Clostridium sp.]|nr:ECF transporter S component [Clostridium sp.]